MRASAPKPLRGLLISCPPVNLAGEVLVVRVSLLGTSKGPTCSKETLTKMFRKIEMPIFISKYRISQIHH